MKSQISISIPADLAAELEKRKDINRSAIACEAFKLALKGGNSTDLSGALGKYLTFEADKSKDARVLMRLRDKSSKNAANAEAYHKGLRIFCEKYAVSLNEAVNYAEGRKEFPAPLEKKGF